MRREDAEQGRRWLAQAEADLDAASYNFDGERFYIVCFLAQQSAEKAIKAYLYARGEERVAGTCRYRTAGQSRRSVRIPR